MAKGDTYYSDEIKGDKGNYDFVSTFDVTDGYVGITQRDGDNPPDRVLLSPGQIRELIAFVKRCATETNG